jgi:hypothetical protein
MPEQNNKKTLELGSYYSPEEILPAVQDHPRQHNLMYRKGRGHHSDNRELLPVQIRGILRDAHENTQENRLDGLDFVVVDLSPR